MIVKVNGKDKELPDGATLKEALEGEYYVKGTLVSVYMSTEKLTRKSEDFEIVTDRGTIVIRLDDSNDAKIWREISPMMSGLSLKWVTEKVDAFGAFQTNIKSNKSERMCKRYDCFFSLGGNDNQTTYFMIAKEDHKRSYGAGSGRIGHITKGRHMLNVLHEGDYIKKVRPLKSEESLDNIIVTTNMKTKLEDGYKVDTCVAVDLNYNSPKSAEHLLILADKRYINISEATGSYVACSDDQDITMVEESKEVRDKGTVVVRSQGVGLGRVLFYKERRQLSMSHNSVGKVVRGLPIISLAKANDMIGIVVNPPRLLSVGMTQKEAFKFLESRGVKQKRIGDTSDDAIVVEQIPERTIDALKAGEVETFAVKKENIYKVSLNRKKSPASVHYFEKVTGLSHKPIGSLKVFFTFEGMPMITFEGDKSRAHTLYPDDPFKKCKRGDLGLTNQVKDNSAGLIGIRLKDDKIYGPTGEEGYSTNIFGRFEGDLDDFMRNVSEGKVVYVMEGKI